jgi:hypothetical protein
MNPVHRSGERLRRLQRQLSSLSDKYIFQLDHFSHFPLTRHRLDTQHIHKAFYHSLQNRLTPTTHPHLFENTQHYELQSVERTPRSRSQPASKRVSTPASPPVDSSLSSLAHAPAQLESPLLPVEIPNTSVVPQSTAPLASSAPTAPPERSPSTQYPSAATLDQRILRGEFF